jgi:hypothetical protein
MPELSSHARRAFVEGQYDCVAKSTGVAAKRLPATGVALDRGNLPGLKERGGCSTCANWKRRMSSPVAVSGERPRKLAKASILSDILALCLLAEGRIVMSAIMRRRRSLIGFSLIEGSCPEVRVMNPSILRTGPAPS